MWPTVRSSTTLQLASLAVIGALTGASVVARQQSTVFRAGTQTVPVFTTVLGPDGRLVTDLTKDDFEVYDDGRAQPITVFANEVQPISIVVMLDTSGSMTGNLRLLKDASVQLFTHLLPADKARVGNFGNRITVSPRFTNDQDELIRWLWTDLEAGGPTPLWGAVNVGMTALEHIDGRRVVLVFTDGYDASSREFVTLRDVVARAQSEEFMIYGIGLWSRSGRWPAMGGGRRGPQGGITQTMPPDPGLKALAEETGGGYFELLDTENLGPTFARVAEELHRQYLLGFSASRLDGKLHKLEVRVRQASMTARARKSYVAPGGDKRPS
jgi:Ca-activated chloride channel family protein